MVQAFVGQKGVGTVRMFDADGNATDTYDKITGIQYTNDVAVVSISDTDAEPRDIELTAVAPGTTTIGVTFDGDPGDGVHSIELVSEEIVVVAAPPGPATQALFEVVFMPVA